MHDRLNTVAACAEFPQHNPTQGCSTVQGWGYLAFYSIQNYQVSFFKLLILGLYPQKLGFTGVDGAEDSAL